MPDGHFRSPQPWNGQYSLKKSASKKVLILKKSRAKIPLVMGGTLPDDFSNSEVSELDEIMKKFKEAVQEHIDEVLSSTESPINTHDHIMESIRENASRVVDMKQTFDDAVNEIIRLIQTL